MPALCRGLREVFTQMVPSPKAGVKAPFLIQLACLGNGPIAPVGGPAAPPIPLHHVHITRPYRRKPPH